MGLSIWEGTHNSTLWEPGRWNVLLVFTGVLFMTFTDGGVGIIIPGRDFVCICTVWYALLYIWWEGARIIEGIEDGWTDVILSLLSTQTDGRIGSVAARGSVEPIEFPSLM